MLSNLVYPFWSKSDRRLRTLWRIIVHLALWIIFSIILVLSASFIIDLIGTTNGTWTIALGGIIQIIAMLSALYLAGRFVDRRPSIRDFGLNLTGQWWRDLLFGLALGAILQVGIFAVEYFLGWVTVTDSFYVASGESFILMFGYAIILFVCVGIYEEMLSRGYHMRNIAEGFRFLNPQTAMLIAIVISSLVFGILHIMNPNASLVSTVNIALAGILLGLPVLLTGRLGTAIGLHITWNFVMNNIFGFPVSGQQSFVSVLAIQQKGPDMWTGGAFGPEAGIIGLIAIVVGCGLIVLWVRLNGEPIKIFTGYTHYQPRKSKNSEDES